MGTNRNVVWTDPSADQNIGETLGTPDIHNKIANDLGGIIANLITSSYENRELVKNLIANGIREQIKQYLREYDNVVAEDILNNLKVFKLGEIKGWESEVDFEYATHGKLSTFGHELKKEFERLKTKNQLEQVKKRVIGLNPIPGTECDNNDGKIWLSNVLTIIDEEMKGSDKEPSLMEVTDTPNDK